jgi:hypothetical protein
VWDDANDATCWMMRCSSWRKKRKKYHHKKLFYVWIIIARARLPLEKVKVVVPLSDYGH